MPYLLGGQIRQSCIKYWRAERIKIEYFVLRRLFQRFYLHLQECTLYADDTAPGFVVDDLQALTLKMNITLKCNLNKLCLMYSKPEFTLRTKKCIQDNVIIYISGNHTKKIKLIRFFEYKSIRF